MERSGPELWSGVALCGFHKDTVLLICIRITLILECTTLYL